MLIITVDMANLLTHSLEHSPWEADRFATSQEIPRNLWSPKVHCLVYKCPPPAHILRQIKPLHALTSHLLKIHLSGLPSTSADKVNTT